MVIQGYRKHLLATTAATVAAGIGTVDVASAGGDIVVPDPGYASWQGPYIGANIGVARLNTTCMNTASSYGYYTCGDYYGSSNTAAATGVTGGIQGGYDWQQRSFVFGAAADIDWTNLRAIGGTTDTGYYGPYNTNVNWLASFRGRMGLDFDNTLVYFTAGLALGGVQANTGADYGYYQYSNLNGTRVGWVAGVGVEHKFYGTNWSVFGELRYYDLGIGTGSVTVYSYPYQSTFSFEIIQAQVGFNYHF